MKLTYPVAIKIFVGFGVDTKLVGAYSQPIHTGLPAVASDELLTI